MKKLILLFTMIAGACMAMTQAELEAEAGRQLRPAEMQFIEFLSPISIFDGCRYKTDLLCQAFIKAPAAMGEMILSDEMINAIKQTYPEWTSDQASIALKELCISVRPAVEEGFIIVALSCNFRVGYGCCRDQITTAEEVAMWYYFAQQLGFTYDALLTVDEQMEL